MTEKTAGKNTKLVGTRLSICEWDHLELLAEETGVSAHAYRVMVLRAHLKAEPMDDLRRRRIEKRRRSACRRMSESMEKKGFGPDSHPTSSA